MARACTENSGSDVLVVQPTDERMRRNALPQGDIELMTEAENLSFKSPSRLE
jgi:hypothetical protein